MNLLERVLTLLRANISSVVAQAEDPESTLRQLQTDMRNQHVQVKTEVARAIAEGHLIKKRIDAKKAEAATWYSKAEQSVQQGNDQRAREELICYNDIHRTMQRYQQQQQTHEQMVQTLRIALRQLEAKIQEVDTSIEASLVQKRQETIQQRVHAAMNKTHGRQPKIHRNPLQEPTRIDAQTKRRAQAEPTTDRDIDLEYLKKLLDTPQNQE